MKPCIVWQTDFTRKWGAVASMIGVCKQVDRELECVDITHDIPAYDVWAGSMELAYVEPYWPAGICLGGRSWRWHSPKSLRGAAKGWKLRGDTG